MKFWIYRIIGDAIDLVEKNKEFSSIDNAKYYYLDNYMHDDPDGAIIMFWSPGGGSPFFFTVRSKKELLQLGGLR